MQKRTSKLTPEEISEMIERLEKGLGETKDPAEQERLSRLVTSLRIAIVSNFVNRPSGSNEVDKNDET